MRVKDEPISDYQKQKLKILMMEYNLVITDTHGDMMMWYAGSDYGWACSRKGKNEYNQEFEKTFDQLALRERS